VNGSLAFGLGAVAEYICPMRRFWAVFLFLLLYSLGLNAEQYPLDQSSPQHAVHLHFYALSEDHYTPSRVHGLFPGKPAKEAERLAIQLKQIFDSKGLFLDMEKVPNAPDFLDSLSGKHKYVLHKTYPEVFLVKEGNRWVYGASAQQAIPSIHSAVFHFGTDALMNWMPGDQTGSFLGLKAWQWIGIGVLLLLAFLLHKLFTFVLEHLVRILIKSPVVPKPVRLAVHKAAIPFSYFLLLQVLEFFIPVLQLQVAVSQILFTGFHVAEPIFLTLTLYRIVDVVSIFMERRAAKTDTTLDDQLVPLVRKMAKVVVVIIGIVWVLSSLDFNVTALVAGVSIGGLAFALAAQDTIKNMFGSLMIFIDKPFQVGDWIQADGLDGTVEEVGFRSTRVRTFANSVTYVPNGKVADMIVNNMGMRNYRRFNTHIAVTYDTAPHVLEVFVEGLKGIVLNHPQTWKDTYEIHVNNMGAHSIDVLFYVFFDVPTWSEELKIRQQMILEIMRLAEYLGIRFAFPTQTLHIEEVPGQTSLTPSVPFAQEQGKEKMEAWLASYKQRVSPQ